MTQRTGKKDVNMEQQLKNDCMKHAKTFLFALVEDEDSDQDGVPGVSGEVSKGKKFETFLGEGLKQDGYTFERAGSQKPHDFREVKHPDFPEEIIHRFEVKKTTQNNVMCNDTLPTDEAYYLIVLIPKKENKQSKTPKYLFSKGRDLIMKFPESVSEGKKQEFIERVEEVKLKIREDFKNEINKLKEEFNMGDVLRVHMRPGFNLNIANIMDRFEELA